MSLSFDSLPTKIKLSIFSLLKFADILDCRLVCSEWHDLVNDALTDRNCWTIDKWNSSLSFSKEPFPTFMSGAHWYKKQILFRQSIVRHSKLKYISEEGIDTFIEMYNGQCERPIDLMTHFGETVTHLDLIGCDKEYNGFVFTCFVRHLGLFKVLQHLEIYSPEKWTDYLYNFVSKNDKSNFVKLLKRLLLNENEEKMVSDNFPTEQDFSYELEKKKSIANCKNLTPNLEKILSNKISERNEFEKKYFDPKLFLETVKEFKDRLNHSTRMRQLCIEPIVEKIVQKIQKVITDTEKIERTNHSVRILTLQTVDDEIDDLLAVLPNVEEIHLANPNNTIKNYIDRYLNGAGPNVLKKKDIENLMCRIGAKVTSIAAAKPNLKTLMECKLQNLKHVDFYVTSSSLLYSCAKEEHAFTTDDIESVLVAFPSIESFGLQTESLSLLIFPELITQLKLDLDADENDDTHHGILTALKALTNLKLLQLEISGKPANPCIFGHEIINLSKVLDFHLIDYTKGACLKCNLTLLSSFCNLQNLTVKTDLKKELLNIIWMRQPNLKFLKLTDYGKNDFCPDASWPPMNYLTELNLKFSTISKSKRKLWDIFSQKLRRLRTLRIYVDDHHGLNMMTLIKSNMPLLKLIKIESDAKHNWQTDESLKRRGKLRYIQPDTMPEEWIEANREFDGDSE